MNVCGIITSSTGQIKIFTAAILPPRNNNLFSGSDFHKIKTFLNYLSPAENNMLENAVFSSYQLLIFLFFLFPAFKLKNT